MVTPRAKLSYILGDTDGWYVEISFMARVVVYIVILGIIIVVVFVVLKCLRSWDIESENASSHRVVREHGIVSETTPIRIGRDKRVGSTNRTAGGGEGMEEEDEEGGSWSSSSEELYDAKLCVICYDEQRNCFFVPCGHCATCYDCAQRIFEGEGKMCPICRRMINKVRKLYKP